MTDESEMFVYDLLLSNQYLISMHGDAMHVVYTHKFKHRFCLLILDIVGGNFLLNLVMQCNIISSDDYTHASCSSGQALTIK